MRWRLHDGPCQTPSEGTRSWAMSPPPDCCRDSSFNMTLLTDGRSAVLSCGSQMIFWYYYNHVTNICVINNYDLSALNGCWSLVSLWRFIYTHNPWEKWEGWALNLRLTTQVGWLYHPKSICNRCVIERLCGAFIFLKLWTHGNLILQKPFLHFRARLNCDVEQNCLCHVVDHT